MTYELRDIPGYPGYKIDTNMEVWSFRSVRPSMGVNWRTMITKEGRKLTPRSVYGDIYITIRSKCEQKVRKVVDLYNLAFNLKND